MSSNFVFIPNLQHAESTSWICTSVQARCSKLVKSTSARQKSNMWIISCARTLQQTARAFELFSQTTICQHYNRMPLTTGMTAATFHANHSLTVHFCQLQDLTAHCPLLLLLLADHILCYCWCTVTASSTLQYNLLKLYTWLVSTVLLHIYLWCCFIALWNMQQCCCCCCCMHEPCAISH